MNYFLTHKSTRCLIASGLLLWAAGAVQAQNPVTFSIDMASQPGATQVYVRGSFNGWSTDNLLTNDGVGTIYSGTVNIAGSPGDVQALKFYYDPGANWEGDPNRQFVLRYSEKMFGICDKKTEKYLTYDSRVFFFYLNHVCNISKFYLQHCRITVLEPCGCQQLKH